jgi:thiol-disulfide isomerase/thioredoxin
MKQFLATLALCTVFGLLFTPVQSLAKTDMSNTALYRAITQEETWLNTSRALKEEDLKGRIILLDFWTFCCINCMHVIPDLKYLEETFGDKLTVIGVHSAKFKNEKDTSSIRNAILRYGIEHPVVNDANFNIWQDFGVHAWPTFILIGPNGKIIRTYPGEGNRMAVEDDVRQLLKDYQDTVTTTPLPLALEKDKMPPSLLSFPGKLAPSQNGLFISDSAHHRILEISLTGNIRQRIGSGKEGYKDGSFDEAQFKRPQGLLYHNNKLYIADTENHALRMADLTTKTVSTLAGNGTQGNNRWVKDVAGSDTQLSSPWDLALYPDETHILIAMAGSHQLWSYDLEQNTVSVVAGNGRESIDDGRYPSNSLSQPSGVSVHNGELYFVDSETSSLRRLKDNEVTTLIGTGLFNFGYEEGKRRKALMQHPLGVYADASGIYVADSYNHAIRRYDTDDMKLHNLAGNGTQGLKDGKRDDARLNEPSDVKRVGDILYIADTNNHAIRTLNLDTKQVGTLSLTEIAEKEGYSPSDTLPNLVRLPLLELKENSPITIQLSLPKGWKINHDAPSYLAIFQGDKTIQSVEKEILQSNIITLSPLSAGNQYRLQSTLYYCEAENASECLIKSFDQLLVVRKDGTEVVTLPLDAEK